MCAYMHGPQDFILDSLSQTACLTAGSHEPRASQRVTTWEDHSPHARNVQHTDSEDRVMPLASFQKEAKGVASPVPPPEGRHQRQHVKHSTPETDSLDRAFLRMRKSTLRGQVFTCPVFPHVTLTAPGRGMLLL